MPEYEKIDSDWRTHWQKPLCWMPLNTSIMGSSASVVNAFKRPLCACGKYHSLVCVFCIQKLGRPVIFPSSRGGECRQQHYLLSTDLQTRTTTNTSNSVPLSPQPNVVVSIFYQR